jgi:poly(A) polymerase
MNALPERLRQPLLLRITSLLPEGVPVFLVGGAIRDALLNRAHYDLDFVTPGDALKIAQQVGDKIGAAYFPLDTERNMARLVLKPDVAQDYHEQHPIRIDFSAYQGANLTGDLVARDFTINAMAVEVHDLQTVLDPLGGIQDLLAKRLRACSERSFINDPVRVLRAVRFSIGLELNIPSETVQLLRQAVIHLPSVSAERMRDELFRILIQTHPGSAIRLLDKLEALEHILPEICLLKGVDQSSPHIMDAWEHTVDVLSRLESILDVVAEEYNPDKASNLALGLVSMQLGRYRPFLIEHMKSTLNPDRPQRGLLFLAGLYHDVGKRKTQTVDDEGKIRFIEHEHIGAKLADKRGQLLKLSRLEIDRLVTIVKHHMRPSFLSHTEEVPSRKAVYRFFRDTGAAGVDISLLSLADILATYGPTLPQERWNRHLEVVRELLHAWWEDQEERVFPIPLIDGDQLMKVLDLSPGPVVGYLLETIREAQVAGDIHTTEEATSLGKTLLQEYRK